MSLYVTNRTQKEQKVGKAAEEWQTTFDSILDPVMILDREFRIVRVNAPPFLSSISRWKVSWKTTASFSICECPVQPASIFGINWRRAECNCRSSWSPPVTAHRSANTLGNWELCPSSENRSMIKPSWMPSGGPSRRRRRMGKALTRNKKMVIADPKQSSVNSRT